MMKIEMANSQPNWMEKPNEGYGFSNDANGTLGAPSFETTYFFLLSIIMENA